jgi:D-alanyl-D-alanine carboxypeptidase
MKSLGLLLFAVFLISARNADAQTVVTARIDSLFDILTEKEMTMATITVRKGGEVIYDRQVGYRDITKQAATAPDKNTKYRIGSISKLFTAVMVMQLIEEGLLKLDTRISEFYPSIPGGSDIRIAQLLNHHSGLLRREQVREAEKLQLSKTEDEFISKLSKYRIHQEDKANGHYSNINYILLGLIIQKVLGDGFDDALKKRITGPLKLRNTYNLWKYLEASRNEAHSFSRRDGKWVEDYEYSWNIPEASGYIVSTSADITAFIHALFHGKLVSDSSLALMKTMDDRYGFGLMEFPFDGLKSFGHTGRIEGFISSLSYFPERDMSIGMILNAQVYPMNDILIGVLSILEGDNYKLPDFRRITLSPGDIDGYKGTYQEKGSSLMVSLHSDKGYLKGFIKKKGGILKKKFSLEALKGDRFVDDQNGIFVDFVRDKNGALNNLVLRISGARIQFVREHITKGSGASS